MQLKNNLYTITGSETDGLTGYFNIDLIASCFIYKAHFPGEPITPGVCIVQICKELLEELLQKDLTIISVKNVKFLSVLSPENTLSAAVHFTKVTVSEDQTEIKAQATIGANNETKAKISLVCKTA